MTFDTYCNGASCKTAICPYQDVCKAEIYDVSTWEDVESMMKFFMTGRNFCKEDCIRDCEGRCHMPEISKQIKDKAEIISSLLKEGKHVELLQNKDGLRIISLDRKAVK